MASSGSHECVTRTVEALIQLKDDGSKRDSSHIVEFSKLHDDVVQSLDQQPVAALTATVVVRSRLSRDVSTKMRDTVIKEADMYRALLEISRYLLGVIPDGNGMHKQQLEQTMVQCTSLLRVLARIYTLYVEPDGPESDESLLPPSNHQILYQRSFGLESSEVTEDTNVISIDKEQLAMEEDELVKMASTPIPTMGRCAEGEMHKIDRVKPPLSARMAASTLLSTSDGAQPGQISMDDWGILRGKPASERVENMANSDWWALTADSVISSEQHQLTINPVVFFRSNLKRLEVDYLTLDVGTSFHQWLDQCQRIIQGLQGLRELQQEAQLHWHVDELAAARTRAYQELVLCS